MSFYLLPPVSYQTQQKLKNDMQKKKERKSSRERNALAARSSNTSMGYDQKSIHTSRTDHSGLKRPPFTKTMSSTNLSIRSSTSQHRDSTNIGSRSSNETEISQYSDDVASVQFDNLSITSKDSKFSIVSKIKQASQTSTDGAYNYNYSKDINEILAFSKELKRKNHAKKSHQMRKAVEEELEEQEQKEEEVDVEQSKFSPLELVYSDVSSIFSTRNSIIPPTEEVHHDTKKKFASRFRRP